VAYRTPILPCIETIGWIIDHANMMKCMVNNEESEFVGIFLPVEVQKYDKIKDPKVRMNTDFVVRFYEIHDTS
jgi:hypothetical protein